jgi:hypothetical protein
MWGLPRSLRDPSTLTCWAHFIRDKVRKGEVTIEKVGTSEKYH